MKTKFCTDCKTSITPTSIRCNSCNTKNLYRTGKLNNTKENHSQYIDGRTYKLRYCEDCRIKLKGHGLPKRCKSCSSKDIIHPSYIDGRSKNGYPRCYSKELKEQIKKRDSYICQNCNMTQEEHYIVYGRDIEIHHIDYDRQNCKETNLITLCKQCNIRANYNRNYWLEYYNKKIGVRYGY